MDTTQINSAANLMVTIAKAQGIEGSHGIAMAAEMIKIFSTGGNVVTPTSMEATSKTVKAVVPEEKKRVLLARRGQLCTCRACSQTVFQTERDLYDGMPTAEFVAAFKSLVAGIVFPSNARIQNVDDAVITDCPVCKKELSLLLWGSWPKSDFAIQDDVGSVGGEGIS